MKNSFYLVIPSQRKSTELLARYGKKTVKKWVSLLPTANPALSTRLLYDFIAEFNIVKVPVQQRLESLEILRPLFLSTKLTLRSRLMRGGFPKTQDELRTFELLVALEKNIALGYWIAARELTRHNVGWLQGKNTALAIQRTIKGLSGVLVTHYIMSSPAPDWLWGDLHSLYNLSVKIKKQSSKVVDETVLQGNTISIEDCYKQVLLLSLTDPTGLAQKEVEGVYQFIEKIAQLIMIEKKLVGGQERQCIIPIEEDKMPYFDQGSKVGCFLNLSKLYNVLSQEKNFCTVDEVRFSALYASKNVSGKLSGGLFQYLFLRWKGVKPNHEFLFDDRLDRYIAIGLDSTHSLLSSLDHNEGDSLEVLVESFSKTELLYKAKNKGILSIGSLVSIRKITELENNRYLAIVVKISMPNRSGGIVFKLSTLAPHSSPVTFLDIKSSTEEMYKKGLFYTVKEEGKEKSYLLMDSFMEKDGDKLRLFMNEENFPVILGGRCNIGLGYWQFECTRVKEEELLQQEKIKGYDFI